MADGVRRHVRQDEVGRAAERRDQGVRRRVVHEIHLEDRDPFDRLAGEQVDAGDAGARVRLAYDLRPAAGRDAQVDHGERLVEEAEFLVEPDQLGGGAGTIRSEASSGGKECVSTSRSRWTRYV